MLQNSIHCLATADLQVAQVIGRTIKLKETQQVLKGTVVGAFLGMTITKLCTVGMTGMLTGGLLGGIVLGGNLAIWHATQATGTKYHIRQWEINLISAILMTVYVQTILVIAAANAILNPASFVLVISTTAFLSIIPKLITIVMRERAQRNVHRQLVSGIIPTNIYDVIPRTFIYVPLNIQELIQEFQRREVRFSSHRQPNLTLNSLLGG